MKKTATVMILAVMICSGCNSAPAETAPQTAPVSQTTTAAQTTTAEQTTAVETMAESTETAAEKTPVEFEVWCYTDDISKIPYYMEDAKEDEYSYIFDYAYVYPAIGIYDHSGLHPEAFDVENYVYTGEQQYTVPESYQRVTAGDTAGKAKIRSAETTISKSGNTMNSTKIVYDGEYELTGSLHYFAGDDYGISAGDVTFSPKNDIAGYPLPAVKGEPHAYISEDYSCYMEFGERLSLGNIIYKRAGISGMDNGTGDWSVTVPMNEEAMSNLEDIIGTGTENVTADAKVRLSDIVIEWNDTFGMNLCRANLLGVEVLPVS